MNMNLKNISKTNTALASRCYSRLISKFERISIA